MLEAPPLETAGAAIAAFYGSWLPDIDRLGSRVHRLSRVERSSFVTGLVGFLLRLPALAFAVIAMPENEGTHGIGG